MKHPKQRYFETRDGRCLPFTQVGEIGEFCIVLDDSCLDILDLSSDCKYFIPDLFDLNEISSLSDSWRSVAPSPDSFRNESEVERHAKDVLDLAKIFRMNTFQIIGGGEVADWLRNNYPGKVKQSAGEQFKSRIQEDCDVALSN